MFKAFSYIVPSWLDTLHEASILYIQDDFTPALPLDQFCLAIINKVHEIKQQPLIKLEVLLKKGTVYIATEREISLQFMRQNALQDKVLANDLNEWAQKLFAKVQG